MNKDTFEEKWEQIKEDVQEKWEKLTTEDLEAVKEFYITYFGATVSAANKKWMS